MMATKIKPIFQYYVFNLFIFVITLVQFSLTASDTWLHQLLIARQFVQ
jgi:hypothetical protein